MKHVIEEGDAVEMWEGPPLLLEERGRPGRVLEIRDNEAKVDVELADGTTKRGWFYVDLLTRA